jgi:hypothetical protein
VDVRDGLRLAIEMIDRQRRGQELPLFTEVVDTFEEEFPPGNPLHSLVAAGSKSSAANEIMSEIQIERRGL